MFAGYYIVNNSAGFQVYLETPRFLREVQLQTFCKPSGFEILFLNIFTISTSSNFSSNFCSGCSLNASHHKWVGIKCNLVARMAQTLTNNFWIYTLFENERVLNL
jgi:hypothetical protein